MLDEFNEKFYGKLPWGLGLLVAPILGLAFVIFLPFIGIAAILYLIGEKCWGLVKRVAMNNAHILKPTWEPLRAFLSRHEGE